MKRTAQGTVFGLLVLLLLGGCGGRESFLDILSTSPDDVPRILAADPAASASVVPEDAMISVLFSKSMSQQSVEDAFTYSYSGGEYTVSDGTVEWSGNGRVFTFTPPSDFPPGVDVTVRIESSAETIDGLNISEDYEWTFTASVATLPGPPTATSFTSLAVEAYGEIAIHFDEEMLRSTVEGSLAIMAGGDVHTIDDGEVEWLGTTMHYHPTRPFILYQVYTVSLNNNGVQCRNLSGVALNPADFSFDVTTSDGIYVSKTTGLPANQGFPSDQAVDTIEEGVSQADVWGLSKIFIAEGNYTGETIVINGMEHVLEGGWNADFSDFSSDLSTYPAIVNLPAASYCITIDGAKDITIRRLVLEAPDLGTAGGIYIYNSSDGITIDNCEIHGPPNAGTNGYGIVADTSNNILVQNSVVEGCILGSTSEAYGIYLGTCNNVTIQNNSTIRGGPAGSFSYGIMVSSCDSMTIEGNALIEGDDIGNSTGISIESASTNALVQNNQLISAGTGPGSHHGIFVGNSSDAVIRDNDLITGGESTDSSTYGIRVLSNSDVDVYRNTIVGGESTAGINNNNGIYVDNSTVDILDNFIVGGSELTSVNSDCVGIVLTNNAELNIINNTILGGGAPGATQQTSGIWTVGTLETYVVNNIILGGVNPGYSFGIEFSNVSPAVNNLTIYHNTFALDTCQTGVAGNLGTAWLTVADLEANYGPTDPPLEGDFPHDNLEYSTGDIVFVNPLDPDYDFSIAGGTGLPLIRDNGNSLDTLLVFGGAVPLYASFDRFGQARNLASIDRGAHEFSP